MVESCPVCQKKHRKFPHQCYHPLENELGHDLILFGNIEPYASNRGNYAILIDTIRAEGSKRYPGFNCEHAEKQILLLLKMKEYLERAKFPDSMAKI